LKVSIWVFDLPTNLSLPQAMAQRTAFCPQPTSTGMNNAVPVVLSIGGQSSNTVTIAVQ
jgi:hypothetical protein